MSIADSKAVEDEYGWYFNLDVAGIAAGNSEAGYRVLESDIEMMWEALRSHQRSQDKCINGHRYDEVGSLSDVDGRGYDYIKCTRCGYMQDAWVYIRYLQDKAGVMTS